MNYKKLHISPLIRACKKKDQIAQMELYERYHLMLYHAAYGILKNRDDAQDAMQEGMISAFEKLDQFKGEGDFGANWQKLDLKIASRMDGNNIWIDSGNFDLKDFFNQKVNFGFRYTGSGKSTYDATFFVDDIRVIEQ